MSPVSPIPNLPPVAMPVGVRPVGQERKREPETGPEREENGDESPASDTPPAAETPSDPDPELNPDDRGRIIDVKA